VLSRDPITDPRHDRSGPDTFWTTVNTRVGSSVLRTGDRLRVDGDGGRVEGLKRTP
jgi:hypothetical protein